MSAAAAAPDAAEDAPTLQPWSSRARSYAPQTRARGVHRGSWSYRHGRPDGRAPPSPPGRGRTAASRVETLAANRRVTGGVVFGYRNVPVPREPTLRVIPSAPMCSTKSSPQKPRSSAASSRCTATDSASRRSLRRGTITPASNRNGSAISAADECHHREKEAARGLPPASTRSSSASAIGDVSHGGASRTRTRAVERGCVLGNRQIT